MPATLAEVELDHRPAGRRRPGQRGDLAVEGSEVAVRPLAAARDRHVAAAEKAPRLAERHVDVERQRPAAGGEQPAEVAGAEAVVEVRGGRVRGVARQRAVVLAHQGAVEAHLEPAGGTESGGLGHRGPLTEMLDPAPPPALHPGARISPTLPPPAGVHPTRPQGWGAPGRRLRESRKQPPTGAPR
jgi:hypothetical protein